MYTEEELQRRKILNEKGYWEIPEGLDTSNFDFNWRPYEYERPYIHQFGTQHQKSGGPKFIVQDNEGVKYHDFQHAIKLPDSNNRSWRPLFPNITIDFSWHPDETEPPFIYVFGNQWYDAETMPTYQYRVKGATEKKYINILKATLLPSKENWEIPLDIDDSNFDYSWVPSPYEPPMIWEFGTQWQQTGGPKYIVKNNLGIKYIDFQKVKKLPNIRNWRMVDGFTNFDFSWHPDDREPSYMYEFGTQHQKAGGPIYVVRGATQKKYCSDQIAYRTLIDERNFRPLQNNISFDYTWHPDPNDPPYMYVFGNQWYDAEIMPTIIYRVKGAIEKKYVNTVKAQLLPIKESWEIPDDISDDFDYSWRPNPKEPLMNYQFGTQWQKTGGPKYVMNGAKETKYIDILKARKLPNNRNWRIVEPIENEKFDFSWHPDDTEEKYNYVFGNEYHSAENMPTIIYKNKNALSNKYSNDLTANLKIESINYDDSIFDKAFTKKLETKYTYIGNVNLDFQQVISDDNIPHIHIIDNVAVIVPNNFKKSVYDKFYDFPYVKYHNLGHKHDLLDIIFISNGEIGAEENYNHLVEVAKKYGNRIKLIQGINGRVKSQHEAANSALTPWYFLVNAKCRVNENFDFSWQPDRMKQSRHYIFTATNNLNDLEYGHMAIVANNKKLTLETKGDGLDFTLDKPHEVININSGIGIFNTSEWDTWRTSFREVLKLRYYLDITKDSVTENRLKIWSSEAYGDFSEFALRGASDAINYYQTSNGDFNKLKLSYDWQWLKEFFDKKYT